MHGNEVEDDTWASRCPETPAGQLCLANAGCTEAAATDIDKQLLQHDSLSQHPSRVITY